MVARHAECQDTHCSVCLEDALALGDELRRRIGGNCDLLGAYHGWLAANGIPNETEWGWVSPESYDENNIAAFVASRTEADRG